MPQAAPPVGSGRLSLGDAVESPISKAAVDLIVKTEIDTPAYYKKKYQHFDWPEGSSGPTVGIGYDCGYCTAKEIQADWAGLIDDVQIEDLVSASGIKGDAAERWVKAHKTDVTIPYDVARRQFDEREMPKWIARVRAALPNTDQLSPDSLGALVSLAYNRGCSFDLAGPRYVEMRALKQHMASQRFDLISNDIRAMKRLWSPKSGLYDRREKEAALFESGLRSGLPPASAVFDSIGRLGHDRPDSGIPAGSAPPSYPSVAARSKTGWLAGVVATVVAWKKQLHLYFHDGIDGALALVGPVKDDVSRDIGPIQSLLDMMKVNAEGILAAIAVGLCLVALCRHLRDKRELETLRSAQTET